MTDYTDYVPDAVPSTAAIARHPIHPMIVPFPIASLVGALVTDIVASTNGDPFWAQASRWLLLAGLITGVLAALFGLIDFLSKSEIRRHSAAWVHFLGNGLAMVLTFVNLAMRSNDPEAPVPGGAIFLSLLVAGILVVTGWLGGELSYRYRIGVMPRSETVVNR